MNAYPIRLWRHPRFGLVSPAMLRVLLALEERDGGR